MRSRAAGRRLGSRKLVPAGDFGGSKEVANADALMHATAGGVVNKQSMELHGDLGLLRLFDSHGTQSDERHAAAERERDVPLSLVGISPRKARSNAAGLSSRYMHMPLGSVASTSAVPSGESVEQSSNSFMGASMETSQAGVLSRSIYARHHAADVAV